MDPLTLLLAGAPIVGDLVDTGLDQYNQAENRKLQRRSLKNTEKNSKTSRLLSLLQQAQGGIDRNSRLQRLQNIRNSGY